MKKMKKLVTCLAVMALLCVGTQSALAATLLWTGAADGDWTNPANWDAGAVPVAGDYVKIQFAQDVTGTLTPVFPTIPAGVTVESGGLRLPYDGDTASQNASLTHIINNGNAARSSLTILGTLNTLGPNGEDVNSHNSASNMNGFDLIVDGGVWNSTGNLELRQTYDSTANGSTPAYRIEVMNGGQINLEGRLRSTDAGTRGFMRISGNSSVTTSWLQMPPTATDREFFIDIEPGSYLESTHSTQATPGNDWFTNLASVATSATDGLPRLRTSTPGYKIDVSWYTSIDGVPTVRASAVPIPEPSSLALVGLGLLGVVCTRRRR